MIFDPVADVASPGATRFGTLTVAETIHSAFVHHINVNFVRVLNEGSIGMNKTFIALLGLASTAALMPSAAFAQSGWSISIGSGGGYYGQPYGGGYTRHDDKHDRLEDQHDDVHDDIDQEHDQAHQYWMSNRAHRRLHRDLREDHADAHDQLEDNHDQWHSRSWQRRYSSRYRNYGGYGY